MTMEQLSEKIVDGIIDQNLNEIIIDIAEIGLDNLLDESFIKDLPVIGLIVKSVKGTIAMRDRIFLAKVVKFLYCLKSIPLKDRESFRNKITSNIKLKKKIGEYLVIILDRIDDLGKPEIIAKAFGCYLSEKISITDFRRLASAIDTAFIDDLKLLIGGSIEKGKFVNAEIENLVKTGLIKFEVEVEMRAGRNAGDIIYSLTPLGHLFKMVMTDIWYDPSQVEKWIQVKWKKDKNISP